VLVCSNVQADALGDEQLLVDDLRLLAEHAGNVACASATKRWPGAATSTPTSKCGTWCARPTTRPSG
jgi:4-hydroxyphenylpyruvate dioxygenase